MSIDNNDPTPEPTATNNHATRNGTFGTSRRIAAGVALVAVLIVGAGAGAFAMKAMHPGEQQVLLEPVAINAMEDGSLVALKGQVAEVFGNKFIITDATGRSLVDTGRSGTDGDLVATGETVTAQGRFDDGFVRASMIVHADGSVDELRGPRRGPDGFGRHGDRHGDRHGPRGMDRDDRGPGADRGEQEPMAPAAPVAPAPAQ